MPFTPTYPGVYLEEVPSGFRCCGRFHYGARRAGLASHLGHEVAVDLGTVEVRHHHARRQLGDLAGHAHEEGVSHPSARGSAQGDSSEVADFDEGFCARRGSPIERADHRAFDEMALGLLGRHDRRRGRKRSRSSLETCG